MRCPTAGGARHDRPPLWYAIKLRGSAAYIEFEIDPSACQPKLPLAAKLPYSHQYSCGDVWRHCYYEYRGCIGLAVSPIYTVGVNAAAALQRRCRSAASATVLRHPAVSPHGRQFYSARYTLQLKPRRRLTVD